MGKDGAFSLLNFCNRQLTHSSLEDMFGTCGLALHSLSLDGCLGIPENRSVQPMVKGNEGNLLLRGESSRISKAIELIFFMAFYDSPCDCSPFSDQ